MITVGNAIKDIFQFPVVGTGFYYVWSRNVLNFKRNFVSSLLWLLLEPLFYLLAIGYGVGYYIGSVNGVSFLNFYFPALVSTTAMLISFYEGTYGCFRKLRYQRTYEVCLRTPISVTELAVGEISWGATKGFLSALFISLIALNLDLLTLEQLFPFLLVQAMLGWLFSALGMLLTTMAKSFEFFSVLQIALILPMALFSTTYFPIERIPEFLWPLIYVSPLTHGVSASRAISLDQTSSFFFLNLAVLFSFSVIFTNWSSSRLKRILID
ncbi:MAG: ABC transporter permease [Bdellovibrionales bacterium]|nr:ABC transporter permease [Bdellovibrionales bacterium]